MKKINGFFSDKIIEDGYMNFNSLASIGFFYSSDIRNGTNVRVYLKELPKFDVLYDFFLSSNKNIFFRNKNLDICLSLFYDPYFLEFYNRLKSDIELNIISLKNLKYIKKYMLDYLANPYHFHSIVEENLCGDDLRNYYKEKDLFNKSKELLNLYNKSD